MPSWLVTLGVVLIVFFVADATSARADDAVERRIQAWIERLKTDPVPRRRTLLRELRDEACANAGHPPVRVSERTETTRSGGGECQSYSPM